MSSIEEILDSETIRKIVVQACENDESVEVISDRIERYSAHTVGFLGSHHSLEITIKRKSNPEPVKLKFFVKSVPRDSDGQSQFVQQQRVFNHEAAFFNELMPKLMEAVELGEIEPWAPSCYLANDELVVLEDLRARGYSLLKTKCFEGPTLKAAVKTMARLHAASILAEHRLGKPLGELYPDATREQMFSEHMAKHGSGLLESLIRDVAEKEGRKADNWNRGTKHAFMFVNVGNQDKRVVCHGDAWPNNVMMADDEEPKCLLVDYQIVRYAPRMFDVAEMICLSTTKEVRDREEKLALKTYWNELCETLRKCEPELARPSLEQLEEEYEEAKIAGLFNAILYYPTILLGEEVYREYDDETAVLKKFVFRQNNDCIMEHIEKDEAYGKRIAEVVIEFLDRCDELKD
ncbi:uncharacterized protein LOC100677982 [Nasonia vitripennis]|uniref:CHK kinase-like domain-containing protein n=1 Tax=Nasonia vitripennis TaxID=7425 RepID=A0A7M7IMD4_NASVI|nr:uncharacterized protein LOC100677982 [Nasonia vitripennis]